jgi:hypothetical protein
MIRELDFSKITLRLIEHVNKDGDGDEDDVIAKLTGNTIDTLKRCLYTPTQLILKDKHGHDNKITVSLKYIPIKMRLDPSESFNNQGILRVDVLDAADLPAADRNGFSDPYCKFVLNDLDVYKTKTQKKTLHPAWNEYFEVPVRSRTAADFVVNVYDWDFGDKADFLGKSSINLELLEPFTPQEVTLTLDGKSGKIRLRMLFKPNYVVRSRQGSSTFSGTFALPGKVIGAPVKGVGKGAAFVGGNVVAPTPPRAVPPPIPPSSPSKATPPYPKPRPPLATETETTTATAAGAHNPSPAASTTLGPRNPAKPAPHTFPSSLPTASRPTPTSASSSSSALRKSTKQTTTKPQQAPSISAPNPNPSKHRAPPTRFSKS